MAIVFLRRLRADRRSQHSAFVAEILHDQVTVRVTELDLNRFALQLVVVHVGLNHAVVKVVGDVGLAVHAARVGHGHSDVAPVDDPKLAAGS